MELAMNEVIRDETDVSGSVQCISCGHKYKPHSIQIPLALPHHQYTASLSEQFQILESQSQSLQADVDSVAEMMAGKTGLKSLLPQNNPSVPKPNTGGKRVTPAPEPLYRKAKLANAMREMVKTPVSTASTGSLQTTYGGHLLHLDERSVDINSSAQSNQGQRASAMGSSFKQKYNEKLKSSSMGALEEERKMMADDSTAVKLPNIDNSLSGTWICL